MNLNPFSLTTQKNVLILAPMEGVMDAPMRALLAEAGGFDFAVSEFIRVSQNVHTAKFFRHHIPELSSHPIGRRSLPLQIQLLGSHPERLAHSALEACAAGARAIDLNFGCPSPTVTRHGGGSALLKTPGSIRKIIETVRKTIPPAIPLSAKIRLGWEKPEEVFTLAQAVLDGGAQWLVIHARTRAEKYSPGVHWQEVAETASQVPLPIVANGDIFSLHDLDRAIKMTGCRHFMIGRGALLNPFLAQSLATHLGRHPDRGLLASPPAGFPLAPLLFTVHRFAELAEPFARTKGYLVNRIKQWFSMARAIHENLIPRSLMNEIGQAHTSSRILEITDQTLNRHCRSSSAHR